MGREFADRLNGQDVHESSALSPSVVCCPAQQRVPVGGRRRGRAEGEASTGFLAEVSLTTDSQVCVCDCEVSAEF